MKKVIFICLIFLVSIAANAQLESTKWKGTIHSDNDIDVIFNYKNDTLEVLNVADSSTLEALLYTVKDSVLTLQKIYGQSGCDVTGTGQYKFDIKDDTLYITLLSDACDDRSSALNNSKWAKIK